MRRRLTALGVLFSVGFGSEAGLAQSGSDIINIFGGLVQTAISQAIQAEWRKLPPAEISCIDENLRQRGTSIGQLAQQGFSPNDARLADVRRFCRGSVAHNPPNLASSPSVISIYAVDGLNLGAKVSFESSIYRQYQCSPSEQFDGFSWCARKVPESSKRGTFTSSYSILHSRDGTVSYVNPFLEPAWFSGNEANEDIARLAKKYGAQPNVMAMPQREGVQGLMASWGAVTLLPLDADNVAQLAQGRGHQGGLDGGFPRQLPPIRAARLADLPPGRRRRVCLGCQLGPRRTRYAAILSADASTLTGPVQPQVQANIGASSVAGTTAPAPVPYSPAPPPPASSAPAPVARPDPDERARQRIKDTLSRIAYRRADLPNENFRTRIDTIASRLAPVGETTDSATLKGLMPDCDAVAAIFDEAAEFNRVSEVASRKVTMVNGKLQGLGFDAPLVQELKTAVAAVGSAQTESDLATLRRALSALNGLYDTGRLDRLAAARANGFDTIESYEDYRERQSRLSGSGIILKKN